MSTSGGGSTGGTSPSASGSGGGGIGGRRCTLTATPRVIHRHNRARPSSCKTSPPTSLPSSPTSTSKYNASPPSPRVYRKLSSSNSAGGVSPGGGAAAAPSGSSG